MNIEDATAVGQGLAWVAVAVASGYGAWKARTASKSAGDSKDAAQKAAELSAPTGNGFAKSVKDSLERIEKKIDDHISAHANAEVASHRPRRILKDVNEL